MSTPPSAAFRDVPRTGVIYVMTEAGRQGWTGGHPDWVNFGQGAPEIGAIDGAPDRVQRIDVEEAAHEYAPVDGLVELRDAVAALYNARYRQGKASQYTRDNVAISAGGRLALTRVVSTLGRTHIGHVLPDYTAYEELLGSFGTFVPIPVLLDPDRNYAFGPHAFREEVLGRGLSAFLLSNPCNPTGRVLQGPDLEGWVETARELDCTLIFDEFYSHYIYTGADRTVSAARVVEDVDQDPVVIIDGLTKNWRYPGWRVSWTVGPRSVIDAIGSAGSFLDGGCAHPMQRAALPLVDQAVADQEADAIQTLFRRKRLMVVEGLEALGIRVDPPQGGFYCWADLSRLPDHLNTGMKLFRALLEEQVIVVPGEFFDINPGRRRPDRPGRFEHYVRFSFGPDVSVLERGLERLGAVVRRRASSTAAP